MWKKVGPLGAAALPLLFDTVAKKMLARMLAKANPAFVDMVRWEEVTNVIRRHRDLVGRFMTGEAVSLKPIGMDLTNAVDHCVIYGLIHSLIPAFEVPRGC